MRWDLVGYSSEAVKVCAYRSRDKGFHRPVIQRPVSCLDAPDGAKVRA